MEQNVYITNASLNMIFKSLRNKKLSLSREQLISHVSSDFENEFEGTSFYDNMYFIFNTTELKEIYFEGMVLKNITQLSHIVNHKFLYKKASLNPINRHFLI